MIGNNDTAAQNHYAQVMRVYYACDACISGAQGLNWQ